MLTTEQIFEALRPLCKDETALDMLLKTSMDEYRAIEAAVLAEATKEPGPYISAPIQSYGKAQTVDELEKRIMVAITHAWHALPRAIDGASFTGEYFTAKLGMLAAILQSLSPDALNHIRSKIDAARSAT